MDGCEVRRAGDGAWRTAVKKCRIYGFMDLPDCLQGRSGFAWGCSHRTIAARASTGDLHEMAAGQVHVRET
jgi:hypothetical protein